VVDVTTSLAGPYCTELLAALGADVVKVEPPGGGDEARTWGPPFHDGEGTLFLAMNAGKRSLALDLRRGHEVLLRLVERADVFVQSLRPGLAVERGLGSDDLLALNPRLVYCSINAFGRTGPWSTRPGYDPLMQAAGGIISVTGEPGRPGVRVGVSLVDQGTGTWGALGIVAALGEREKTGKGTVVDVALFETALAYMGYHLTGHLAAGTVPRAHGTAFPAIAPYETFPTADGDLMVAAANDRLFAALAETVGAPELASDPRFATNPDRVANREALVSLVAAEIATRDADELLEALAQAGVPSGKIRDVPDAFAAAAAAGDPATLTVEHPSIGPLELVRTAVRIDDGAVPATPPPPRLGEHTREILRDVLGRADSEIDALAAAGTIQV